MVLTFFEIEARFPRSAEEAPPAAVADLAEQLKLGPALFTGSDWTGRTITHHREQVRAAFGFRAFTRGDEDTLAGWLAEAVCPSETMRFLPAISHHRRARTPDGTLGGPRQRPWEG